MRCLHCDNLAEYPEMCDKEINNVVCKQCFMDGLRIRFMDWLPPIAASRLIHVDDLNDWIKFVIKVNTRTADDEYDQDCDEDCDEYDAVLTIMEYRLDLIRVNDRSLYDNLRPLWLSGNV